MNTYCNLNIFSNGGVHHENILPFKLYDIQPITLFFFFLINLHRVLNTKRLSDKIVNIIVFMFHNLS